MMWGKYNYGSISIHSMRRITEQMIKLEESKNMKHKHYDVIVAFAEGKTIQSRFGCFWVDDANPSFNSPQFEFRVKPEPKTDTTLMCKVDNINIDKSYAYTITAYININCANLYLTFDGTTGKLKSAEVLDV